MIEFKGVSKSYISGVYALDDVSLKIEDGEFVFVLGYSGAGKSTFLKMMMAEEKPSKGTISINGFTLPKIKKRKLPYFRRTMGVVFQDFRLIESKTVYENVAFALWIVGVPGREIRKRVLNALELVGMGTMARRYPRQLSGGEQQRVAIARAIVTEPKLIVADEPTGNIDPKLSFEIVDLLRKLNDMGTTVIMVTHEHELISKFDGRIIIIDHGKIAADSKEDAKGEK